MFRSRTRTQTMGTGTTFLFSMPSSSTWAHSTSQWFAHEVKPRTCPQSPTPPTWTFSRTSLLIWTRRAGTCSSMLSPINSGFPQVIRTTSAWSFFTSLPSRILKWSRWVLPTINAILDLVFWSGMIKSDIVASFWTRKKCSCWERDSET